MKFLEKKETTPMVLTLSCLSRLVKMALMVLYDT